MTAWELTDRPACPVDAHNDQVPTSTDSWSSAAILEYYRSVESTLLVHLCGRRVIGSGAQRSARVADHAPGVELHIADLDDLDEAVRSGIVGFALPDLVEPLVVTLRVRVGDGSEVDTVATCVLALTTAMLRDGLSCTVLTDGVDGLLLIGAGAGRPAVQAARYAADLAAAAPEIATTDATDVDGRALLEPGGGPASAPPPAPYSLVALRDRIGVVVPITLDEVAAVSAGMPLDFTPRDVAARIAMHGDLAAVLSRTGCRSA